MSGNNVTIKFTDEQQKLIKERTGKSITEFDLDTAAMSEADLDRVAGGGPVRAS
jgi:uncharacterized protein (DUF1778 family)